MFPCESLVRAPHAFSRVRGFLTIYAPRDLKTYSENERRSYFMSIPATSSVWQKGLAACLVILTLAGCGKSGFSGPTGQVSGKVTLNGAPLREGSRITLISTQGYMASGATTADGSFKLTYDGSENTPAATYKAQLSPPVSTAPAALIDPSKPLPAASPDSFPSKYAATATSGLEFVVKEGVNPPINIEL